VLKTNHTKLAQSRPQASPERKEENQEDCATRYRAEVATIRVLRGFLDEMAKGPITTTIVPMMKGSMSR